VPGGQQGGGGGGWVDVYVWWEGGGVGCVSEEGSRVDMAEVHTYGTGG
jgi:hypothetical protein